MKSKFTRFLILSIFLMVPSLFAQPKETCKDFWKKLKLAKSDYLYTYKQHALLTDVGNEGYDAYYASIKRQQCLKEWTILIYMNADSDLTLASYADIYEMENIGSSVSVDVLVYHDSNMNTGSRYLHIIKDPAIDGQNIPLRRRRFRPDDFFTLMTFEDHDILSPVPVWLPEQNSGDIGVFEDFLTWGFKHYPSKKVAVIIWTHGMGWSAKIGEEFKESVNTSTKHVTDPLEKFRHLRSVTNESNKKKKTDIPRKISFDLSSDTDGNAYITIPQIRKTLSKLRRKFLNNKPLDVLGADACLMMQLEVANELKDQTRYFIASASAEGAMGWPYTSILRHIIDAPLSSQNKDAAYEWVKKIPSLYVASYSGHSNSSQGKDLKALMVAINAQEMKTGGKKHSLFPMVLNKFGQALLDYIQEDPKHEGIRYDQVRSLIGKVFSFSGVSQDLYHFTLLIKGHLREEKKRYPHSKAIQQLQTKTDHLQDTISNRIVIAKGVGKYYYDVMRSQATKGISIWLPASNQEFREYFDRFKQSQLYRDPNNPKKLSSWARFNQFIHSKDGLQGIGKIKHD